jgi:transcriptional regulator with XRE-family HTH domain
MSNENTQNNLIGTRIRAARKAKGLSQTELAVLLDKALRTVQKYENGEIEPSIAMINEIAKVLGCDSTFLIGYDKETQPLTTVADVMNLLFLLDTVNEINFEIEVKRPPHYDEWECSLKFKGRDINAPSNASLCLFLEEYRDERDAYREYRHTYDVLKKWMDLTLAYYSHGKLTQKEIIDLPFEERLSRMQAIINERYGKKES